MEIIINLTSAITEMYSIIFCEENNCLGLKEMMMKQNG